MFDSETQIRNSLFQMDLDVRFQTPGAWANVCETVRREG